MIETPLKTFCCPMCDYPYEPGVQTTPPCPSCGSDEQPEECDPRVTIIPLTQERANTMMKIERTWNEETMEVDFSERPLTTVEKNALLNTAQETIDAIDPALIA